MLLVKFVGYERPQIMNSFVSLSDIGTCVAAIIAAVALVVSVFELHKSSKEAAIERVRLRKQATIDKYFEIHADLLAAQRAISDRLRKISSDSRVYGIDEMTEADLGDEELQQFMLNYLSIIEPLATGVNTGVYDLSMLDRLYGENLLVGRKTMGDFPERHATEFQRTELSREYVILLDELEIEHRRNTTPEHPNSVANLG